MIDLGAERRHVERIAGEAARQMENLSLFNYAASTLAQIEGSQAASDQARLSNYQSLF